MLRGVDAVDGALDVAVIEGDEPLDLLLGIADQAGADLDLRRRRYLRLRWHGQQRQQGDHV